jgi:hypothetical protein
MKVEVSDNVTLRIPHNEIPGQIAPIYLIGLPDDIQDEIMEEIKLELYKGGPQKSYKGIALTPVEQKIVETLNELIREVKA